MFFIQEFFKRIVNLFFYKSLQFPAKFIATNILYTDNLVSKIIPVKTASPWVIFLE